MDSSSSRSLARRRRCLPAVEDMWIAIFGPPRILIIDQEGAFAHDAGMAMCERHAIHRKLRA
eukprot:3424768-Pyramimonas_sp.AAC.1